MEGRENVEEKNIHTGREDLLASTWLRSPAGSLSLLCCSVALGFSLGLENDFHRAESFVHRALDFFCELEKSLYLREAFKA